MKRLPALLIAVLAILTLAPQSVKAEEVDWSILNLNVESLKRWGTRHYEYKAKDPGKDEMVGIGEMTFSTEVTEDAVVLKDHWEINYRGDKIMLDMTMTCRKDGFLSPVKIESKGKGSDEVASFVVTVKAGKAKVMMDGRKPHMMELPEGTITTAAMMRLITLMPKTPDMTYRYKYSLESEELNLKKDYRLSVLKPEMLDVNGVKVPCTKFKLEGGGVSAAYYWVDQQSVLQRLMLDERKVIDLRSME